MRVGRTNERPGRETRNEGRGGEEEGESQMERDGGRVAKYEQEKGVKTQD